MEIGSPVDGKACWITAGVGGSIGVPASVSAGVLSSWVAPVRVTGVLRCASRSITASLTTDYGRRFRRISRR